MEAERGSSQAANPRNAEEGNIIEKEESAPVPPASSVLTPEQLARFEAAFAASTGETLEKIDTDTVTKLLVDLRPDVSQEQIDELMERFDAGRAGVLEKCEVLEAAEAVCGYELEKEQMDKAFRLFDYDGNGFIPLDILKEALQKGESGLSNDEFANFLNLSGCKNETSFDFREFVNRVAFGPVIPRGPPKKKKKGKGKKK